MFQKLKTQLNVQFLKTKQVQNSNFLGLLAVVFPETFQYLNIQLLNIHFLNFHLLKLPT